MIWGSANMAHATILDVIFQITGDVAGAVIRQQPCFMDDIGLIKWVTADVKAEGKDELGAASLEWKDISPLLPKRVKEIYFAEVEKF